MPVLSRRFTLFCLTVAWAVTLMFSMVPQAAADVRFWQDPVVTHTNGMRLASSTSLRSHNVYWRCDEDRVGYCDGQMHSSCKDDWRDLGTRKKGCYPVFYGPRPGMTGTETGHAMDGLEMGDSQRLGTLRMDEGDALRMSLAPPAPSAAPVGGSLLDALRTLGGGGAAGMPVP